MCAAGELYLPPGTVFTSPGSGICPRNSMCAAGELYLPPGTVFTSPGSGISPWDGVCIPGERHLPPEEYVHRRGAVPPPREQCLHPQGAVSAPVTVYASPGSCISHVDSVCTPIPPPGLCTVCTSPGLSGQIAARPLCTPKSSTPGFLPLLLLKRFETTWHILQGRCEVTIAIVPDGDRGCTEHEFTESYSSYTWNETIQPIGPLAGPYYTNTVPQCYTVTDQSPLILSLETVNKRRRAARERRPESDNKMADCGSNNRFSERAQMQELNERFCHYVQNMKSLTDRLEMNDSSNDLKRIQELEEEIVAARNMYNKEIQGLQDQLDQNCKERMQIEINNLKNSQLIADFRESILALNTAILQKEKEKKNLELMLCQKEAELRELQMSAGKPATELEELRRELQNLHSCLEEVQKKYEKEHKQNLELQASVQQLRCKLDLQQENHCQDMVCMREKAAEAESLIQELEEKLRRASMDDGGAMEMLRKIREANNAEMQRYRQETEQNYNQSVMDLTMCLNKERIQLEQIQEENQCLRQHINNLTTEIKMLQDKLLSEEENKVAVVNKLNCEQQKNQQHISELKTRLEEVEDLLLAKMKELHSKSGAVVPSLQGDIASFKCMLEAEERRLRNASVPCCKKSSPCKSYLPCPRTSCTPANQSSCRRASAPSSCPPVNLRPCPPPLIPNPCKPAQRSCAPPCPAPASWALPTPPCCPPASGLSTRLPACPPTCPLPHSLTSCQSGVRPNCPSSACLPPSRLSCPATRPVTPSCLPVTRMSCPSPSPLSLCSALIQSWCPSTPPLTSCPPACPPANPPSSSDKPGQCCSMSACGQALIGHSKHNIPLGPLLTTECCNGEPQKGCAKPPTSSLNSCKAGQGSDYFNNMLRELNKNSVCGMLPVSKPLVTAFSLNTPTASTIGNIKIVEVAANGYFVRLLNISHDIEEDIGNYVLQQNMGGHPVTMYRFPPRTRVSAGSCVTVWAANARVPHNPPKDFLWKECNKLATGPEYTTILCKPNGQAVTWFTPAPGNSKLKNSCNGAETLRDCNHHTSTNDCQVHCHLGQEWEETTSDPCHVPSTALSIKEKPTSSHLPTRCPWTQSTASIIHPDFNIPRTQSMGNEGNSQCRDSRSQSSQPGPPPGNSLAGSVASTQCRKYSFHRSNRRLLTCSAASSSGQQKATFQPNCTPLQHLQSRQNLAFQPPMPHPPPIASW
ncbi:uncharacterized protein LOC127580585 [Pristis pectinata]|uniref:uncharacterized protein LOC127580585 n=1 Tax=Pristis pectinata TaxID=685728 RepID=UPI00223C9A9E|nr:uncharacterized protein LOC127580585 [Pristis pectinata]